MISLKHCEIDSSDWRNQQSEMQVGGPTEAADVLDSFLSDRGWGYQKFISKPEQVGPTARDYRPISPGET